jgi:type IV pilus assembly protein PilX
MNGPQRFRKLARRAERGVTLIVVLVLLSVMLLGGLAFARMSEIGMLASGNAAYREASLQASQVGINNAFAAVRALPSEASPRGDWYWPTIQAADGDGVPAVNWAKVPEVVVGSYQVKYVVERLCTVADVTDTLRQCLIKQTPVPSSSRVGSEPLDPPNSRQFRITVRVQGPKDTETWVQSLVTKGS